MRPSHSLVGFLCFCTVAAADGGPNTFAALRLTDPGYAETIKEIGQNVRRSTFTGFLSEIFCKQKTKLYDKKLCAELTASESKFAIATVQLMGELTQKGYEHVAAEVNAESSLIAGAKPRYIRSLIENFNQRFDKRDRSIVLSDEWGAEYRYLWRLNNECQRVDLLGSGEDDRGATTRESLEKMFAMFEAAMRDDFKAQFPVVNAQTAREYLNSLAE